MILVDTSAWIEYYRPAGRTSVRAAVAAAIEADEAAVNPVIAAELLPFIRGQKDFLRVSSDFSAFHWLEIDRKTAEEAVAMGRKLRATGVTVPATDLLVAASARVHRAALLHCDGHFTLAAKHVPLVLAGSVL